MPRLLMTMLLVVPLAAGRAQTPAADLDAPLVELEALDDAAADVRRFALTARGAPGREVPIPNSQNLFCTLGHDHNVALNYYPDIDTWVFQVAASDAAGRAAGGLATCMARAR
ncbi:MAG: hypothetical protein SFV21_07840 [Rhodospirillaceae bacterium]|nr:hypothetical protein [Rhodospirillaceae bacterium]